MLLAFVPYFAFTFIFNTPMGASTRCLTCHCLQAWQRAGCYFHPLARRLRRVCNWRHRTVVFLTIALAAERASYQNSAKSAKSAREGL
jgi:hypothetical protein